MPRILALIICRTPYSNQNAFFLTLFRWFQWLSHEYITREKSRSRRSDRLIANGVRARYAKLTCSDPVSDEN